MWRLMESQQKLIPELMAVMQHRLAILQYVEAGQPIGRRALARHMQLTERVLRAEVELLSEQGLIDIQPKGMYITLAGRQLVHRLFPMLHRLQGFQERESVLAKVLNISNVFIVAGDSAMEPLVQRDLGKMAAHYLLDNIRPNDRIAVTGGTTLAMVAEMLYSEDDYPDVLVMPARGGLGEHAQTQANLIAVALATKLKSQYTMLQIPDQLSSKAYASLIAEPYVQERIALLQSARIVLHGVGNAEEMARKRDASPEIIARLVAHNAVSEAFGAYFDANGELVYQMPTIGLHADDLRGKLCVAVAGGSNKGDAILSLAKTGIFQVLVTDEGTADAILKRTK